MRQMWVRYVVSIGSVIIGVSVAAAAGLALYLEISGFGTPRDVGPRSEYLLQYSLVIIAGLIVPLIIWHGLLGLRKFRFILAAAIIVVLFGLFGLLGLGL